MKQRGQMVTLFCDNKKIIWGLDDELIRLLLGDGPVMVSYYPRDGFENESIKI